MPSTYVIGDHFEAFIKELIAQGRYAGACEVVRDGLDAKNVLAEVRKRLGQATASRSPRK